MSYVSMSSDAVQRVVEHAKEHPDEQVVGFLIGRLVDGTLIIEDSATGEIISEPGRATMPGESIAKIADDIINQRIKGNVVGWYHSHTHGGVFMSETDIETQMRLQQFSPLITAMVVDSKSGQTGFFRVDTVTRRPIAIPDGQVHIFAPGEDPIPPALRRVGYVTPPTPAQPAARPPVPRKTIIIVGVILTIIILGSVAGIWYWAQQQVRPVEAPLKVEHSPVSAGAVGRPLEIQANVTGGIGGVKNVTLRYKLAEADSWQSVKMLLTAAEAETYAFTIPASEMLGDIDYFIVAFDNKDNVEKTDTFRVGVATFTLELVEGFELVRIVRGRSSEARILLRSINGFAGTVRISVEEDIEGVSVSTPTVSIPKGGQATVILRITARPDAEIVQRGKDVKVIATYTIGAIVYRPPAVKFRLIVTDFQLSSLDPTIQEVARGKSVNYTLTVTVHPGFHEALPATESIGWDVQGLPAGAEWDITIVSIQISPDGTVIITIRLTIKTTRTTPTGTFRFTVTATLGGVSHSASADLRVK